MSIHKVEVVKLERIEPHPNADKMELTYVWGYSCCIGKGQFRVGDLAAYIEPDHLVDVTVSEFAFLAPKARPDGKVRIKVARLRGVISQGLIIPVRPHWKLGDNVMDELKVVHYDSPVPISMGGATEKPPPGYHPSYDVEPFYRYTQLFNPGEPIVATEKIHGACGRFCWVENRMWCSSRSEWKQDDPLNVWWRALRASPWLEPFCWAHPDITVYGEVYGRVQDLTYGAKPGEAWVIVFDLLRGNQWVPWREARALGKDLTWVPIIYEGPYDEGKLKALADGPSLIPGVNHLREGIVIKPDLERTDPELGRVQLKIVSNNYLERA